MTRRLVGVVAGVSALLAVGVQVCANAPYRALPSGVTADRVIVDKSARRMWLLRDGHTLRVYEVSLGASPVGHKAAEGDERTPEGVYTLDYRNPNSSAHRSLHVSYPDAEDRQAAAEVGRDPGGFIMVHRLHNGLGWTGRLHRLWDWTDGCIALTNDEMDEVWRVVPTGTPIEIRP